MCSEVMHDLARSPVERTVYFRCITLPESADDSLLDWKRAMWIRRRPLPKSGSNVWRKLPTNNSFIENMSNVSSSRALV